VAWVPLFSGMTVEGFEGVPPLNVIPASWRRHASSMTAGTHASLRDGDAG